MRIARVILELNETRDQIRAGNPWQRHKRAVEREFLRSPQRSFDRLARVVESASSRGCDLLLFPACAFYYGSPSHLKSYQNLIVPIRHVAAGLLGGKRSPAFEENAALWHHGHTQFLFDQTDVMPAKIGATNALFAISSTVTRVKALKRLHGLTAKSPKCLVLDLGHHQYNGRYMLTLRSVQRFLTDNFAAKPTVILSFWRYRGWTISSEWAVGLRPLRFDRASIHSGEHVDLVDVFEV